MKFRDRWVGALVVAAAMPSAHAEWASQALGTPAPMETVDHATSVRRTIPLESKSESTRTAIRVGALGSYSMLSLSQEGTSVGSSARNAHGSSMGAGIIAHTLLTSGDRLEFGAAYVPRKFSGDGVTMSMPSVQLNVSYLFELASSLFLAVGPYAAPGVGMMTIEGRADAVAPSMVGKNGVEAGTPVTERRSYSGAERWDAGFAAGLSAPAIRLGRNETWFFDLRYLYGLNPRAVRMASASLSQVQQVQFMTGLEWML